jgi:uncharacterized protein (TIGR00730 family)
MRSRTDADGDLEVAVIGSASLSEDSRAGSVALELGRRLAESGVTVVTGGYGGLMGAVSRGAREAGGHVVGLTMDTWPSVRPNRWLTETRPSENLAGRLGALGSMHAVVALDGGVGTLSELSLMWAMAQTQAIAPRIIVLSDRWQRLLAAFREYLVIAQHDVALIDVALTAAEAVDLALAERRPGRAAPRG